MTGKTLPDDMRSSFTTLLLGIADEKLFLGHRNGDWTGLGPFLEEDIAFSNIAQDEIAHAQELYRLAAALLHPQEDRGPAADRLAYSRPADQRYSAVVVEKSDDYDWARAIARQFFFDHYDLVRLPRLQKSCYRPLAELAGKMIQEVRFHVDHFNGWIGKLACGTQESKDRLHDAVQGLWPDLAGLFEAFPGQQELAGGDWYPVDDLRLQEEWQRSITDVLAPAGVAVPPAIRPPTSGGRSGRHTVELDELLADLVEVYDYEPGASW